MTQGFTEFPVTESFLTSHPLLLRNDKNALTNNADTTFPLNPLAGMSVYRSDEDKFYLYRDGTWTAVIDFSDMPLKVSTLRGTIDGVTFTGSPDVIHYGECLTAAATAAKVVTCSGFKLVKGARVTVKFANTNSAAVASLTLNVNNTGAKAIKWRGANLPSASSLAANSMQEFVYDGINFNVVGDLDRSIVYQSAASDDNEYPMLLKTTKGSAAVTSGVKYASAVTVNPSTGVVTATALQGALNGNASSATKLQTARTVTFTGNVSGNYSFDGSTNVSANITVLQAASATTATKLGASNVGAATTPIYLKAGAPVAGTPLAKVATSGAYSDLSGGPDLSPYATIASVTEALSNYATTASLTTTLKSYATTATLNAYKTSNDKAVATLNKSAVKFINGTAPDADGNVEVSSGVTSVNGMTGAVTVHDVTGNAGTATKLAVARTISFTGGITGSGTFDGAGDLRIATALQNVGAQTFSSAISWNTTTYKTTIQVKRDAYGRVTGVDCVKGNCACNCNCNCQD